MNRKAGSTPTLERKIYFYRINAGQDKSGSPRVFDPEPAITVIEKLPFSNDMSGRYLVDDDGNAVCALSGTKHGVQSLRFCRIRRTGLPQLEQAGTVSDLDIAADAGLLESVHVVFFGNNICGADFNFHGPRLSRLGYYLRAKSGNAVPLATFEPILRDNVLEQLDSLSELRLLDLKIRASYIQAVSEADRSLGDAFKANARVLDGNVDDVHLILKPAKDGWRRALERLVGPIKSLAKTAEIRENADRFQVKGRSEETGRVEIIDLLRDQLIVQKQLIRLGERSRAVDPDSAINAIQSAYEELANKLNKASSVSI